MGIANGRANLLFGRFRAIAVFAETPRARMLRTTHAHLSLVVRDL